MVANARGPCCISCVCAVSAKPGCPRLLAARTVADAQRRQYVIQVAEVVRQQLPRGAQVPHLR